MVKGAAARNCTISNTLSYLAIPVRALDTDPTARPHALSAEVQMAARRLPEARFSFAAIFWEYIRTVTPLTPSHALQSAFGALCTVEGWLETTG